MLVMLLVVVVVAPATATLTCASLFLISDYLLLVYLVVSLSRKTGLQERKGEPDVSTS